MRLIPANTKVKSACREVKYPQVPVAAPVATTVVVNAVAIPVSED